MGDKSQVEGIVLPHHEQQPLCTTRLPYRQGRKLTAVKVYTINNESNHLLVFGVPSLNLRQEAKALFSKFGRLLQFSVSMEHPAESFTETYHAAFERIQSARIAKKMLDTKNFYGGSLHVCYAPEFETVAETRAKLLQRQRDVLVRLRNLQREESVKEDNIQKLSEVVPVQNCSEKLNMGEVNTIDVENNRVISKKRRKGGDNVVIEKKFKPCFVSKESEISGIKSNSYNLTISDGRLSDIRSKANRNESDSCANRNDIKNDDSKIEIIDFTSTEHETLTNINESLNYNKFGNEVIKKIPEKPVNTIKLFVGNKH